MSDYISREAVNDLIKAECSPKVAAYLIDAVATIPAADVRPVKWIPVTEQCPEKSGDYLVFDDCRDLYVNEWHCLLKKWQYDDGRITHWQPLPQPPKEG